MMGTSSIPTFANFIPHEFDVLTCLMRYFQSSQQRDEKEKIDHIVSPEWEQKCQVSRTIANTDGIQ